MAEITIQMLPGGTCGGLEIRVTLQSDEDCLPWEHEQLHRDLILQLLPGLELEGSDEVAVWRERPAREPAVG